VSIFDGFIPKSAACAAPAIKLKHKPVMSNFIVFSPPLLLWRARLCFSGGLSFLFFYFKGILHLAAAFDSAGKRHFVGIF